MNKVTIIGRLTRDPEIRWTTGAEQTCLAKFGIAVDRRFKNDGSVQADFFNCVAWGKLAEHMERYWAKGMKAGITGRIENNTWKDRDGNKRVDTQIIVEEIDFCEKRAEAGTGRERTDGFENADEELPFNF